MHMCHTAVVQHHVRAVPVAFPGGFQGFLETSQAPAIAYSTVLPASYSLGATGTDQSI